MAHQLPAAALADCLERLGELVALAYLPGNHFKGHRQPLQSDVAHPSPSPDGLAGSKRFERRWLRRNRIAAGAVLKNLGVTTPEQASPTGGGQLALTHSMILRGEVVLF
jgi:hypothetical protein